MNSRIASMLDDIRQKKHHIYRKTIDVSLCEEYSQNNVTAVKRVADRLSRVLGMETPVILDNEKIVFTRTVKNLPALFTDSEWDAIKSGHYIHELGHVCNITPDYESTISRGLEARKAEALQRIEKCKLNTDQEGTEFLESVIETIDAIENLSDAYRQKALNAGNEELANILLQIPRYGARTFHEALQFFRILHFTLWCEGEYHNTIGRFDQYMYPYLKRDLEAGILNKETAFALLEEFFISFNKDSDLYPGVQQGDNGQSLVLGGLNERGEPVFNMLSEMCLLASKELKLIDPKINLRVNNKTEIDTYKLGTELTKEGLGFPQYSNDDVIIPGLVAKGYCLEDARNYGMAACWETIIPGCGMDIPNIGALSFPKIVDQSIRVDLDESESFEVFFNKIIGKIFQECSDMAARIKNLWMIPAPFMSILMDGCIDSAKDISLGNKYNNFGFHGTGIATAADSLAAIKKYIFEEKSLGCNELIEAIDDDYRDNADLLYKLRYESPKMGNDDDYVDDIAVNLIDAFADALETLRNERGGCIRAGTGSAMYYLWHAKDLGASADGRRKGEAFGANYSPSLYARLKGPISVVKSFTKPNLIKAINGGPLTLEFHETLFQDIESREKVAMLVKSYIDLGGHQLQLNAVNRETLLEAQKDPEKYKNLIVRIWGWSAYFIELDKEYQDHVISRFEY